MKRVKRWLVGGFIVVVIIEVVLSITITLVFGVTLDEVQ